MSTQLKTLARSLQAAGYASQGENTTRLLVEVSNKLVERVWNGEQLGNQIFVCSNVRSKTPALYFVTPEAPPPPPADAETATVQHDSQPGLPSPKAKRIVFCINKQNQLKYYIHNGKKWQEESFKGLDTPTVHPSSKLGGISTPFCTTLVYQDPEGRITPISYSEETDLWQQDPPLQVAVPAGSALFASLSGAKFYVHFTGKDGDIEYQALDFSTGNWQGGTIPNSKLNFAATAMAVTHDKESQLVQVCALAGDSLVLVTSSGEKTELGTVKGDVFTPSKSAQDSYTFNVHGNMNLHGNFSPWSNSGTYNRGRNSGNSGRIGGRYGNYGGNYGSNNSLGSSGLYAWWYLYRF